MDSQRMLTIGIPTFNREKEICYSLTSILNQINETNKYDIEIIVSDNASDDNTKGVVSDFIKKFPEQITYYRNKTNVGLDGNMDYLFKRSNSAYVWMFSDDDIMEDGAIDYVLDILRSNERLKTVFVNYSECDDNWRIKKKRWRSDIEEDIYCKSGDEYWIGGKFLFGLLSSIIIRVKDWNSVNVDKYNGTLWNFVGVLKEILSKEGESYIVSTKYIRMRETGEFAWGLNGHFMKVMLDLGKVLYDFSDYNYNPSTRNYLFGYLYKNNLRTIISAKKRNYKSNTKDLYLMMLLFKRYSLFWILHLPLYFVPSIVYKQLNKFRKRQSAVVNK